MTLDELQVLITANKDQLMEEINKTNSAISRLKKNSEKQSNAITNVFKKLKTSVVAIGIGKAIADSINEGMNAIESDSIFQVSLGKYADDVRTWSNEVGEALGLNATTMRKNTGVIFNMVSSMGLAEKQALTMSKGITLLANDMASFYNLDTDEAFNKLRAGITGETEPLKALGILVDENTIKQVAYSSGIAMVGSELTQQQKVLARYVAILKQTGNAQGDLARTLNSPANLFRRLKSEIQNCATTLGSIFMPVIQTVVPYLIAFVKLIGEALSGLANFLGIKESGLVEATESAGNNIGGLSSDMASANKSAKSMKQTLASFDEITNLNTNNGGEESTDIGGVNAGAVDFDLSEYDAGLSGLNDKVEELTEKLRPIAKLIGIIGAGFLGWKIGSAVLDTIKAVSNGLGKIKTALTKLSDMKTLMIGITLTVAGIALEANGIIDAIQNELNGTNFTKILTGGLGIVAGGAMIGKTLGSSIIGAGIGAIVAGVPAFITGVIDALKNGLNKINGILIPLGSTMAGAGIGAIIGSLVGPIGTGVGALIGLLVGLLTDLGLWLHEHWNEISNAIEEFFTVTIPEKWNAFWTWIDNKWNEFTTWLGEIPYKIGYYLGEIVANIVIFFTQTVPEKWNEFWTWIGNKWNEFTTWIGEIPSKISEYFEKIGNNIKEFFTVTIPERWNELMDYLKSLPQKFLDIGKDIIDGLKEGIVNAWEGLKQKWNEFTDGFVQGFKDKLGIHSPSTVFAELGGYITEGLEEGIGNGDEIFAGLDIMGRADEIKESWANIAEWFKENVTTPLITVFAELTKKLTENFTLFSKNLSSIFMGIRSMMQGEVLMAIEMMNYLIDTLQIAMDNIVDSVNEIISSINATSDETGIKLPYAKGVELKQIPIPELAQGGIAERPTVSLIGEAGKEAVLPLENNTDWMDKLASKIAIMINAVNENDENFATFTSNLIVNGRELASVTIDDFNNEAIRRGYKPILVSERGA